jgi:Putative zinc-finger
MVEREERNGKVLSGMEQHEKYLGLCALSTAGELSAEEEKELRDHLAVCPSCREAMTQFETVVDHVVPALAADLNAEIPPENSAFSQQAAEDSFRKRLLEEDETSRDGPGNAAAFASPLAVRRNRAFRQRFDRYYFWLPLAAGLLLCISLGILTFRIGKRQGIDVARTEQTVARQSAAASQETLTAAIRERDAANAQLAQRDKAISELRREIAEKTNENAKLNALQTQEQLALAATGEDKKQLAEERDHLVQEAAASKAVLEASEKNLSKLELDRREDVIRVSSLEARVAQLSSALDEQERTAREEAEWLAKDRDIRELMGARDLYVAEVYDVNGNGKTQKPFGRVFYTKGKSLIFYAYDLNDQPRLKQASTFEAWGRRGPDWTQALKLGIFYEDSISKKRWVMKLNDKKALDQIDAVFVTVEPHGGSEKPTGKPLLFAYLKVAPNHP